MLLSSFLKMMQRNMYILRCAFLFLLFNFKGYSIGFSDFYDENNKLMRIQDPPFFDYPSFECLDDYPSFCGYNPYYLIDKIACNGLKDAIKAGEYILKIPPPYYWDETDKTIGFKERWMNHWRNCFFDRHARQYVKERGEVIGEKLEYSKFSLKYDYLYYWFDLCYSLETSSLEKQIQKKEEEIKRADGRYSENYISGLKNDLNYLIKQLENLKKYKHGTLNSLHNSFDEITRLFLIVYEDYLNIQPNPKVFYERGRILYDKGDTIGFLSDINALIANGFIPTDEINFQLGKAYNDANQYSQAIKILSQAIKQDPKNKEIYFERALAYFETGQFDLALSDYILSEIHPTLIDPNNDKHFKYLKLSKGMAAGMLKGGIDSTIDFVPSLLSTIYGIGKGLWAFSSNPVGISVEMVNSCISCIEFIKDNLSKELIAELIPELRDCLEKWDNLDEEEKGYYIGYVVGKYGVDMLAWGGSLRAVKLFRDVYRANTVLTLEKLSISGANCESLIIASEKYFKAREEYKAKCWLHVGQQEKHIPGTNNYIPNKDKLLISIEKIEELAKENLGSGIPQRNTFGESGYREIVNFGEIIGEHITKDGEKILTSVGEIHYNLQGGYHVSPVHPKKWVSQ